jgi:serine protease
MKAVDDCINAGARIMSLACGSFSQVQDNTFRAAYENGVLRVAAASNENYDSKEYPASYPSVMSVAALDNLDPKFLPYYKRAYFSNHYDQVEIAAPGLGVKLTVPGGDYRSWSGTRIKAILWSYERSWTAKKFAKSCLLQASIWQTEGVTSILDKEWFKCKMRSICSSREVETPQNAMECSTFQIASIKTILVTMLPTLNNVFVDGKL